MYPDNNTSEIQQSIYGDDNRDVYDTDYTIYHDTDDNN